MAGRALAAGLVAGLVFASNVEAQTPAQLAVMALDACLSVTSVDAAAIIADAERRGFPAFVRGQTMPYTPEYTFVSGGRADHPGVRFIVQTATSQQAGQRRLRTTTCTFASPETSSTTIEPRLTASLGPPRPSEDGNIWSSVVVAGRTRALTDAELALTRSQGQDALLRSLGPGSRLLGAGLAPEGAGASVSLLAVQAEEP